MVSAICGMFRMNCFEQLYVLLQVTPFVALSNWHSQFVYFLTYDWLATMSALFNVNCSR